MEYDAVVETTTSEVQEAGAGYFGIGSKHTNLDGSLAGIHCNVDVLDIAHVAERKPRISRIARTFFRMLVNICDCLPPRITNPKCPIFQRNR